MYSLYVIVQRPQKRRAQLVRVACWLAALAVITLVHQQAITRHLATTGSCPTDLSQLGFDRLTLCTRLRLNYFRCDGGRATFGYAKTYIPFETFEYDFEHQAWTQSMP